MMQMSKQGKKRQTLNTWTRGIQRDPDALMIIVLMLFSEFVFFAKLTKWKTNNYKAPLSNTLKH